MQTNAMIEIHLESLDNSASLDFNKVKTHTVDAPDDVEEELSLSLCSERKYYNMTKFYISASYINFMKQTGFDH